MSPDPRIAHLGVPVEGVMCRTCGCIWSTVYDGLDRFEFVPVDVADAAPRASHDCSCHKIVRDTAAADAIMATRRRLTEEG